MSNKTVIKPVRFSPEEIAEIEHKAMQMKITTSKYIRMMATKGKIIYFEMVEYAHFMTELSKIGTNINQIARRLNEQGSFYYEDMTQIKDEYNELCRLLSRYPSTLRRMEL